MKELVSESQAGALAKTHLAIVALICLLLCPDQESGRKRTDHCASTSIYLALIAVKCHLEGTEFVGAVCGKVFTMLCAVKRGRLGRDG